MKINQKLGEEKKRRGRERRQTGRRRDSYFRFCLKLKQVPGSQHINQEQRLRLEQLVLTGNQSHQCFEEFEEFYFLFCFHK